ncbi:MAG: hypothetical protein KPI85_00750 [cyanobacterium endosymbiont of Epithemia adnata isolate EadnSB Bon19]
MYINVQITAASFVLDKVLFMERPKERESLNYGLETSTGINSTKKRHN